MSKHTVAKAMTEYEIYELLKGRNVKLPQYFYVSKEDFFNEDVKIPEQFSAKDAVVKVSSPQILHKSDIGGVAFVDNVSATSLYDKMKSMFYAFPEEVQKVVKGFLVVEKVSYTGGFGSELYLGVKKSREMGYVFSVGLGGLYIEEAASRLKEGQSTVLFHPEISEVSDFRKKLENSFFFSALTGKVRGYEKLIDSETLFHRIMFFIETVQKIIESINNDGKEVVEFEMNPLVIVNDSFIPLDAVLRFEEGGSNSGRSINIEQLKSGIYPESIAIVGVSTKMNMGRIILRNFIENGFDLSRVYILKDDIDSIDGVKCYKSVAEIPERVDIFVFAVNARAVPELLEEVFRLKKAKTVLLIPGGMGETEGGKSIEKAVKGIIARYENDSERPIVIGNNSLGIVSIPYRFDSMFIPKTKLPRNENGIRSVAIISQSGAYMITRMNKLTFLSPDFQISVGNQIDAPISAFLEALIDDQRINTFALYIEGFKEDDGLKVAKLIKRGVENGKDFIIYKGGRTEEGKGAISGHTASIAGDFKVVKDVLKDAKAHFASSFEEFLDLIKLSSTLHGKVFSGMRVGLMSNAGYETVGMADNIKGEEYSFTLASFSDKTCASIREILVKNRIDSLINIKNPLDITPMAGDDVHIGLIKSILSDENVDCAVFGNVPLTPMIKSLPAGISKHDSFDMEEGYAKRVIKLFHEAQKPFVVVLDCGPYYNDMFYLIEKNGVPVFRSADRAVKIFGKYLNVKTRNLK